MEQNPALTAEAKDSKCWVCGVREIIFKVGTDRQQFHLCTPAI